MTARCKWAGCESPAIQRNGWCKQHRAQYMRGWRKRYVSIRRDLLEQIPERYRSRLIRARPSDHERA